MITFGSLFSGIGGLDLGFERAGFKCIFQVEKNPYCRKILKKHWPNTLQFNDVKTFLKGDDNWKIQISSLEDSPVKTSQWQEKEKVLQEIDQACGKNFIGSFARLDPSTLLWKTCTACWLQRKKPRLKHRLEQYLQTFPSQGMMRNGVLYQRKMWEQPTNEQEYLLLPTPTLSARDWHSTRYCEKVWKRKNYRPLNEFVYKMTNKSLYSKVSASGVLNPNWCQWYMGFPPNWLKIK